ncbi:hypothetical protein NBRC110019_02760 [Neptunitalea chrysea]|uniref:FAD-binding oxidoreductase n=1 Tax=Neptunitalea chrysea TaxID=1647581 RepID=A0A9W6B4N1_9FLAO|nr:hypothetical protein NBRC110019_02760 [Neptunitalea chrysea]
MFIAIAAITGCILAFSPLESEVSNYDIPKASNEPMGIFIHNLKQNYLEVLEISVKPDNRVVASVITEDGDAADFYVDPTTALKVGHIKEDGKVYKFAKTLHRSLFLHGTGRVFMMITSFLLFLISITGFILIIKRQQGIRNILSKIVKDNFFQFGHVYLGRLLLIPIILISITGVVLSIFQLKIVSKTSISHEVNKAFLKDTSNVSEEDFEAFNNISFTEIKSIEFPFSTDVSDFYRFYLDDREVLINQRTGEVVSEKYYPFSEMAYRLGFSIHTGENSIIWAFILLVAAISILFFIVSGFKITFKRKGAKIKNKYKKGECTHIILVGSETGGTITFTVWLQNELIRNGVKAYVAQMNDYKAFSSMKQLIVFTSSYGVGEPPANASKFIQKYLDTAQSDFEFAIVGFGSLAYPDYCKFAFDVEKVLENDAKVSMLLPLHTINNQSVESFNQWVLQYTKVSGIELPLYRRILPIKKAKSVCYEVISKSDLETESNSFIIELEPCYSDKSVSGDLLSIAPSTEDHDRLYSIGITKRNAVRLSVKLHEYGKCSNYLYELSVGMVIKASKVNNKKFHFPSNAKKVIMIATGTGIAPFLGMIETNRTKVPIHLFWGARTNQSYGLYSEYIETTLKSNHLNEFIPAYSRQGDKKQYVQDVLKQYVALITETLTNKGVIMICGSVVMQKEVMELLQQICLQQTHKPLSYYQNKNQLRMDCY